MQVSEFPLTRFHVPVFIGGSRFKSTSNPRLPNQVSLVIFISAFFLWVDAEFLWFNRGYSGSYRVQ